MVVHAYECQRRGEEILWEPRDEGTVCRVCTMSVKSQKLRVQARDDWTTVVCLRKTLSGFMGGSCCLEACKYTLVPTVQLGIGEVTSVGANPSVRNRGRSQVWVPNLQLGNWVGKKRV